MVNIGRLVPMSKPRPSSRTEFGQRMYEARIAAGLSQVAVCKELGISQGTLSEAERLAYGSSHTVRFAALYNVSAHWLAIGTGPRVVAEPAPAEDAYYAERFSQAAMTLARDFYLVPMGREREILYHKLRDQIRVASRPALQPDQPPTTDRRQSSQKERGRFPEKP